MVVENVMEESDCKICDFICDSFLNAFLSNDLLNNNNVLTSDNGGSLDKGCNMWSNWWLYNTRRTKKSNNK